MGAGGGAAIGAIAGDAGKGAGAVASTMRGGMQQRQANAAAQRRAAEPALRVTHECNAQTIGRTRMISNQLGYPGNLGGFECKDFDEPGLRVDVGVQPRAGKESAL